MDDLEQLQIETSCQKLVHAFAIGVDKQDADMVAGLFLPKGRFVRKDLVLEGSNKIKELLLKLPESRVTRHICANTVVDVKDSNNASGVSYFTLFDGERVDQDAPLPLKLPLVVGEYHDTFQRTEHGWLIAERRSVAVFRRE